MLESTSREKVLKNIRHAMMYKSDLPFEEEGKDKAVPVVLSTEDKVVEFVEKFSSNEGEFVYCPSESDVVAALQKLYAIAHCDGAWTSEDSLQVLMQQAQIPAILDAKPSEIGMVISHCESLVLSNGSILLSSEQKDFNLFFGAKMHVVIAQISQVMDNVKDSITFLQRKYNQSLPAMFTFVGRPACTNAIEGELVKSDLGARLFLLLVEDSTNTEAHE